MTLSILAVITGFMALVWGADRLVSGASAVARNLGMSPLLIGLTIIGLGTSAPEMLVSAAAALSGNTGLAIGNAIGSNIANIALIVGSAALVKPLIVKSATLKREFPLLFLAMLIAYVLLIDGHLGKGDGILLLCSLFALLAWMSFTGLRTRASDPLSTEYDAEIPKDRSTASASTWLVLGLVVLIVSSKILVWGAINIAQFFGVSDLVIGLTVVAIGTSLPELAAAIASSLKGEHDITIGNVIGSNMFNILAVMGIAGVIHPADFEASVLTRDFPIMFGLTTALIVIAYGFRGFGHVNRLEGGVLLFCFCIYQWSVYHSAL
jgi:cation:H+ antiporter